MNILLTTAPTPLKNPFGAKEKRPPLGLGYLISILKKGGHKVFFIDNSLKNSNFLETNYLIENRIDFVGIHTNTICYPEALKMLYTLNTLRIKKKWNGKIIIGGPHTTVGLETIPEFVDFIVLGEGEKAIVDIIEGKEKKRIIKSDRIKNLDELPYPAWDVFSKLPYSYSSRWIDTQPIFTMNTSRGCPYDCSFCSVKSIWGKKYTCYSAERIIEEIEYLVKDFGAKGIYFREDNFTLKRDRVEQLCELLLKNNLDIKWICETRVDALNEELIRFMYKSGCRAFYFGIESGDKSLLDFLNKRIQLEQVIKIFKICKDIKINTFASFITGIPTETFKETTNTMNFINKELKPFDYTINVFVGLPDSLLYGYTLDNHLYAYKTDNGLLYLKGHNARIRLFRNNDLSMQIAQDVPDEDFEHNLNDLRKIILNRLQKLQKKWVEENNKVSIYGAGLQTERLFKEIDFSKVNISAFYDNDYEKQKKGFYGYKVLSPELIGEINQDVILISLTKHLYKVYDQLKNFENIEIVPLYQPNELFVI